MDELKKSIEKHNLTQRLQVETLGKGLDRSKLVKKIITDKRGRKTTKWVKVEKATPKKENLDPKSLTSNTPVKEGQTIIAPETIYYDENEGLTLNSFNEDNWSDNDVYIKKGEKLTATTSGEAGDIEWDSEGGHSTTLYIEGLINKPEADSFGFEEGTMVMHSDWDERTSEPLKVVIKDGEKMLYSEENGFSDIDAGGESPEGWYEV